MSAVLALALVAGMAVPGSGPGMASAEMEQGLDLSGQWEGIWWSHGDQLRASSRKGRLVGTGTIEGGIWYATSIDPRDLIDEGRGKLRGTWDLNGREIRGIYRQEGDRIVLCFSKTPHPRPTSFQVGDSQHLLVLRRVRPHK